MTLHAASDASVQVYAKALGMPFAVVRAWANCEEQDDGNYSPNNILNILTGNTPGQWGKSANGVTGTYPTLALGAQWSAWLIAKGPYENIRSAIKLGTPFGIARAIELSPWAGSHYGGASGPGCIARQIPQVPNTPILPPRWEPSAIGSSVTVKANAPLFYLDGKTPYSTNLIKQSFKELLHSSDGKLTGIQDGLYLAAVHNSDLALTT